MGHFKTIILVGGGGGGGLQPFQQTFQSVRLSVKSKKRAVVFLWASIVIMEPQLTQVKFVLVHGLSFSWTPLSEMIPFLELSIRTVSLKIQDGQLKCFPPHFFGNLLDWQSARPFGGSSGLDSLRGGGQMPHSPFPLNGPSQKLCPLRWGQTTPTINRGNNYLQRIWEAGEYSL